MLALNTRLDSAGVQPSQSDRDEPTDRGLGRQAAGCCEGVKAITCKLVRRDIIPDAAGLCPCSQQCSDHVAKVLLGANNMLVPMQECRQFGVAVAVMLVGNEGEGFEHSFKLLASIASLVPDFDEIFEVAGNLTFVARPAWRFYQRNSR